MRKLFVVLCLIVVSTACIAEHVVYRMDTRAPGEIFRSGFVPPGRNANLYEHVSGYSCYFGDRTGAFVATTSDEAFARDWGNETLPAGTHFYVYRINPSDRFYNTTTSLMHAFGRTEFAPYQRAAMTFVEQSEWVSHGTIPRSRIIDGTEYVARGPLRAPRRLGTQVNARYVVSASAMDNRPYVWNYREDDPDHVASPDAVCGSSCFGFSFFAGRSKRHAGGTKRTIDNVLVCRSLVSGRISSILGPFAEMTEMAVEEKYAGRDE